jgi:hypothetical protein
MNPAAAPVPAALAWSGDTWAIGAKEVALSSSRSRLFHLRSRDAGHEIDLIAGLPGGDIVAVEIKSSAARGRRPSLGVAARAAWRALSCRRGASHGPTTVPARRANLRTADLRAVGVKPAALGFTGKSLPAMSWRADARALVARMTTRLRRARRGWCGCSSAETAPPPLLPLRQMSRWELGRPAAGTADAVLSPWRS